MKAFILIQSEPGTDAALSRDLTEMPGVRWVERVTGPYDLIAEAEWDDAGTIVPRIQEMEGVLRALTSIVLDDAETRGQAIGSREALTASG